MSATCIVLIARGTRGDVQPVVALARSLSDGAVHCRIVLITAEEHRAWLTNLTQSRRVGLSLLPAVNLVSHESRQLLAHLLIAVRGSQRVLVAHNLFALDAVHICEAMGWPCVALSPYVMPSRPPLGFNAWLQEVYPDFWRRLRCTLPAEGGCACTSAADATSCALHGFLYPLLNQERWASVRRLLGLPVEMPGLTASPEDGASAAGDIASAVCPPTIPRWLQQPLLYGFSRCVLPDGVAPVPPTASVTGYWRLPAAGTLQAQWTDAGPGELEGRPVPSAAAAAEAAEPPAGHSRSPVPLLAVTLGSMPQLGLFAGDDDEYDGDDDAACDGAVHATSSPSNRTSLRRVCAFLAAIATTASQANAHAVLLASGYTGFAAALQALRRAAVEAAGSSAGSDSDSIAALPLLCWVASADCPTCNAAGIADSAAAGRELPSVEAVCSCCAALRLRELAHSSAITSALSTVASVADDDASASGPDAVHGGSGLVDCSEDRDVGVRVAAASASAASASLPAAQPHRLAAEAEALLQRISSRLTIIDGSPELSELLLRGAHDGSIQAVLHHGGSGTTADALHAGLPQVIVPLMFDQFRWKAACERLGVAPLLRLPAPAGAGVATDGATWSVKESVEAAGRGAPLPAMLLGLKALAQSSGSASVGGGGIAVAASDGNGAGGSSTDSSPRAGGRADDRGDSDSAGAIDLDALLDAAETVAAWDFPAVCGSSSSFPSRDDGEAAGKLALAPRSAESASAAWSSGTGAGAGSSPAHRRPASPNVLVGVPRCDGAGVAAGSALLPQAQAVLAAVAAGVKSALTDRAITAAAASVAAKLATEDGAGTAAVAIMAYAEKCWSCEPALPPSQAAIAGPAGASLVQLSAKQDGSTDGADDESSLRIVAATVESCHASTSADSSGDAGGCSDVSNWLAAHGDRGWALAQITAVELSAAKSTQPEPMAASCAAEGARAAPTAAKDAHSAAASKSTMVQDLPGGLLAPSVDEAAFLVEEICLRRIYEAHCSALWRRIAAGSPAEELRSPAIATSSPGRWLVVDAGANIGIFVLHLLHERAAAVVAAARTAAARHRDDGPEAAATGGEAWPVAAARPLMPLHIVAVEPVPALFQLLCINVRTCVQALKVQLHLTVPLTADTATACSPPDAPLGMPSSEAAAASGNTTAAAADLVAPRWPIQTMTCPELGVTVEAHCAAATSASVVAATRGSLALQVFPHLPGNSTAKPAQKLAQKREMAAAGKGHLFEGAHVVAAAACTLDELLLCSPLVQAGRPRSSPRSTAASAAGGVGASDPVASEPDVRDANPGTVHLLKVDVEGCELEVLQGGSVTLSRTLHLAVEAHDVGSRLQDMVSLLLQVKAHWQHQSQHTVGDVTPAGGAVDTAAADAGGESAVVPAFLPRNIRIAAALPGEDSAKNAAPACESGSSGADVGAAVSAPLQSHDHHDVAAPAQPPAAAAAAAARVRASQSPNPRAMQRLDNVMLYAWRDGL